MSQTLRLPQLAWHGTKELALPLPDDWQVEMGYMAGYNRPALSSDQIREAVTDNLIGIPPIRELARGKKEVVIIFDDMTRVTRVAEIVPFVLKELAAAGIPDSHIRFIAALGCHGAMNRLDFVKKLGEEPTVGKTCKIIVICHMGNSSIRPFQFFFFFLYIIIQKINFIVN